MAKFEEAMEREVARKELTKLYDIKIEYELLFFTSTKKGTSSPNFWLDGNLIFQGSHDAEQGYPILQIRSPMEQT